MFQLHQADLSARLGTVVVRGSYHSTTVHYFGVQTWAFPERGRTRGKRSSPEALDGLFDTKMPITQYRTIPQNSYWLSSYALRGS